MAFNNKESKVKFNICNAHIALKTKDSEGNVSYGEPWSFPGSRSLTLNVSGESTEFYADGILYYVASSSGGYEGDWVVARILEKWRTEILKEFIDANGVMLEKQGIDPAEFAFGCQVDGDADSVRLWYYGGSTSKPGTSASTTESTKTPEEETIPLKFGAEQVIPGSDEYVVRAKTTSKTDKTKYDNWFESVYIPSATEWSSGTTPQSSQSS